MKLGKNGQDLLKLYIKTLEITNKEAIEIIKSNKSAIIFLKQESALGMTSQIKNLSILLRTTLMRQKDDFSKLSKIDINFIKNNYGLNIIRSEMNEI